MGLMNNANKLVDAAMGKDHSGTTLQDFLAKFNSPEGKFVDSIDPKSTFDVYIKFYPTLEPTEEEKKNYNSIGNSVIRALGTAATGALKTAENAITGGLLGSLMNDGSVEDAHKNFTYAGQHTFMEYLLEANLVVGGENWFSNQSILPLELSLGPYVQEVTLPNIKVKSEQKSVTAIGEFPVNGTYVQPETNELIMQIVNTKAALHERIFYPWMREVTAPFWSYTSQPYTTADITIDFTKHNDTKYVFYGCRPTQIYSLQGNQDTSSADNLKRQVVFVFDLMTVQSDKLKTSESWDEKLLGTGKALAGSAMHALNI